MEIQGSFFSVADLVLRNAKVSNMAYQKTVDVLDSARGNAEQSSRRTVETAINTRAERANSSLGRNIDIMA